MVYVPANAVIPDRVCIVKERYSAGDIQRAKFSNKFMSPPPNTIAIVKNNFAGPFTIGEIGQTSSSFYAELCVENAVPSNNIDFKIKIDIKYWSVNEIIMSGIIEKDGKIKDVAEFVAVTYSCHSTLILKGGDVYNKLTGKTK